MSIVRVRDPNLSLWQSAVAEVARRHLQATSAGTPSTADVLDHPIVRATNDFVQRRVAGEAPLSPAAPGASGNADAFRSGEAFDFASAQAAAPGAALGDSASAPPAAPSSATGSAPLGATAASAASPWPYSDDDPHFAYLCAAVYAEYMAKYRGAFLYRDWKKEGKDSLDYGVITWTLPNDARVGVIGDWGTGMEDAESLLRDLMVQHTPQALLHLGDIYYSGTPAECASNFTDVITRVFDEVLGKGKRIPVFTIPGNHDYYALGHGFYPAIDHLNDGIDGAAQAASYFCLRTADGGWQFLAMDSGYEDANPANQVNATYAGPWLQPNEVAWHRDKLDNFGGATILLSHHQLFTANATINGMASSQSEFPYLNPFLLRPFLPYFRTRVAAWMWGHEHNFVLFRDGLFGLAKGRLIGASAFEETKAESPYQVKYPAVAYLDSAKYRVSPNAQGYYAHSYAVIDFAGRASPGDPVQVSYYAYPSWYKAKPADAKGTLIYSEPYALPAPAPQSPITFGAKVHLSIGGGLEHLAALRGTTEYYPTVGTTPITLMLSSADGSSGEIHSNDTVLLQTSESAAGTYTQLGAWTSHWLYYYTPGNAQQHWKIVKLDTSTDTAIRFGDAVSFENVSHAPQTMCPTHDGYFTTTGAKPAALFVVRAAR